jgi:hypothetical protein
MALTATPTISSIAKTDEGSTTIITDATVYGSPNADRADVVVDLLAYKVDEELAKTALTITTYDAETEDTFEVTNTIDGHQQFVLVITPEYSGITAYPQYSAVFYQDAYYRVTALTPITGVLPTDVGNWEVVTIEELFEAVDTSSESPNVAIGMVQQVLTFSASQCLGDLATQNAKTNCAGDCKDPKLKQKFDELWLLVYTSSVASSRGLFTAGEGMMRMAESYCDCC